MAPNNGTWRPQWHQALSARKDASIGAGDGAEHRHCLVDRFRRVIGKLA